MLNSLWPMNFWLGLETIDEECTCKSYHRLKKEPNSTRRPTETAQTYPTPLYEYTAFNCSGPKGLQKCLWLHI